MPENAPFLFLIVMMCFSPGELLNIIIYCLIKAGKNIFLLKKAKKGLTKIRRCGNIMELRKRDEPERVKPKKKDLKKSKKGLTKREVCDILYRLSQRAEVRTDLEN